MVSPASGSVAVRALPREVPTAVFSATLRVTGSLSSITGAEFGPVDALRLLDHRLVPSALDARTCTR